MQEWPPVIRVSHLLGGCRAISEPGGKMTISPSTPNKGKTTKTPIAMSNDENLAERF